MAMSDYHLSDTTSINLRNAFFSDALDAVNGISRNICDLQNPLYHHRRINTGWCPIVS